jgi:predicted enzyme related to lactoylglutathione lyase
MLTFNCIVVDCPDTIKLAEFYASVTGGSVTDTSDDRWATVKSDNVTLAFQYAEDFQRPRWPDPKRPQQLHIDFEVDDFEAEGERMTALGAVRQDSQIEPDGTGFVVYIDPYGHPFCLVKSSQPS